MVHSNDGFWPCVRSRSVLNGEKFPTGGDNIS